MCSAIKDEAGLQFLAISLNYLIQIRVNSQEKNIIEALYIYEQFQKDMHKYMVTELN